MQFIVEHFTLVDCVGGFVLFIIEHFEISSVCWDGI